MGFMDLIELNSLAVIEESKYNGRVLATFNSTFISLIQKVDNMKICEEFKLILLCNCIYNLIAKVIEKRTKGILSNSISQEQFAILKGRQIHDANGTVQ